MIRILLTLFIFFHFTSSAQETCIKHWSKDNVHNLQLDSILSKLHFDSQDSVFCDSYTIENPFNYKWYIDFYNKQLGKYFSSAECINFSKYYYREKTDSLFDEIHITQFVLSNDDLRLFRNKYGEISKGYKYYNLKVFTLYKYIVLGNCLYFISSESYQPGRKNDSYFDKVFNIFSNYK